MQYAHSKTFTCICTPNRPSLKKTPVGQTRRCFLFVHEKSRVERTGSRRNVELGSAGKNIFSWNRHHPADPLTESHVYVKRSKWSKDHHSCITLWKKW